MLVCWLHEAIEKAVSSLQRECVFVFNIRVMDLISSSCLLPVPSGPPSTTILASSNKVNGGDDISVLCTVLGEPDVEVEFRWIFPGQKVSATPQPQSALSFRHLVGEIRLEVQGLRLGGSQGMFV